MNTLRLLDKDPDFIVAKGLSDLSPLKRCFRRAHGIVVPFNPLSTEQKQTVHSFALSKITPRSLWFFDQWTSPRPEDVPCADVLETVFRPMADTFKAVTGEDPKIFAFTVNNDEPKDYHRHSATMTYGLYGDGTEILSGSGASYAVPGLHMMMMAENLPHKVPVFTPSITEPRITFAVF